MGSLDWVNLPVERLWCPRVRYFKRLQVVVGVVDLTRTIGEFSVGLGVPSEEVVKEL